MRRTICTALAAALLVAPAGVALGQDFTAAPNMDFAWLGSAEPGNFSLWEAKDLTGVNSARLGATFLSFGSHKKWSPAYKLALKRDEYQLDIAVGGHRGQPLDVTLEVWRGKDERVSSQTFRMAPDSGVLLGLQLDWSEDGTVTASVAEAKNGTEVHKAKLPGSPQSLSIAVSTAAVDFQSIQLGRSSP
jgi:hypothetical protein